MVTDGCDDIMIKTVDVNETVPAERVGVFP